ncbi:MAG: SMC-Scp complex subunit ScpB [Anaerolineae bacterium]|nr:SMC-Scp complex subunit ScpB [Anaerolineae bacterium]
MEGTPYDKTPGSLRLIALVESLLFVADEPVPLSRLADALEAPKEEIESVLGELTEACRDRGVRVQRKGDLVQMVSAPEAAPYIERFLGLNLTTRLSPAALEVLAIVAYRQPITRAEIEAIRGVSCDAVLRTLVNRGLLEEVGRLDRVGRPILYGTTFQFLQHFGLSSLDELPPLEDNQKPTLQRAPSGSTSGDHASEDALA